ncbi:MAG: hypothetical protein NTX59_00010 [Elusimicrobia bacterium]|nr:hypothetical protein [Elusimicrobiota bacterium]
MTRQLVYRALLAAALLIPGVAEARISFGLPSAVKNAVSKLQSKKNSATVIISLTANPASISTGTFTTLTCLASNANGDALTYSWSAATGTISGAGPQVTWTAPLSSGTYAVSCTVSDGKGGFVRSSAHVAVFTINRAPVITSLTANPPGISTGGVTTITCAASDADGNALTYAWSAASGTLAGTGPQVTWTSVSSGTYSIACAVSDGQGGSAQSGVNVAVSAGNYAPVISSFTVNPPSISTGMITTITCNAADPDGDALTYVWDAASGTISGIGPQISWTAPLSSAAYSISCAVSDGNGGSVQSSTNIVVSAVNHAPVIISLTASPTSISTGTAATITCAASDPDGDALTYAWSAASGTLAGSGYQITWTAPAHGGTYPIACAVSDGKGGSVQSSTNVVVFSTNHAPVITSLTASSPSISTGTAATLTCNATDPDGDTPLSYVWSAASGTLAGSGYQVTWTAPASSGTYSIACTVSDGQGGSVQSSTNVAVFSANHAPVITSLTASPPSISTGTFTTVTCAAADPDGDALTYVWSAASGTLAGSGYQVTWTAPASSGTFSVACTVSDGNGGSVQSSMIIVVSFTHWASVYAGREHTLAIKTDGTLWAWGRNDLGQLGLGHTTSTPTPTQVGTDNDWASISGGDNHTLAIKTNGTLWVWGLNDAGQLGIGNAISTPTPTQVGTDGWWSSVSGGAYHSLAVRTGGFLKSWGGNSYGQLGNGNIADQPNQPTPVGLGKSWVSVACGEFHTLAVTQSGTLWAWGANSTGQLGIDSLTDQSTIKQVGADFDWWSVSGGDYHSLAIKTDGTLWAWGYNNHGQLGLGNTDIVPSNEHPVQVGASTDWVSVSGGGSHTLAIKADGTLWAWGYNNHGQLGSGDTTQQTVPTKVGTDTDWASVSGGGSHTLAIKTDGTLWAWGFNNFGQLGLGDMNDSDTPTQVHY